MANFDPNRWYYWNLADAKNSQSMKGTSLFQDGKLGALFFENTGVSRDKRRQQAWQFFPVDKNTYAIRCQEGGPKGLLNVGITKGKEYTGDTVPGLASNATNDSIFWQVSPWGDGTFYLTNQDNGTSWHLTRRPENGWVWMSSNITAPQLDQRFEFAEQMDIDDDKFSTLALPTTTITLGATSTPTTTGGTSPSSTGSQTSGSVSTTPTPTGSESQQSPSPTSTSSSGGLSSGAKAAIGGSIGAVGAIALIGLLLFLWRRRRRTAPRAELGYDEKQNQHSSYYKYEAPGPVEAPGSDVVKHEMPTPVPAKVSPQAPGEYSELPGTTVARQ